MFQQKSNFKLLPQLHRRDMILSSLVINDVHAPYVPRSSESVMNVVNSDLVSIVLLLKLTLFALKMLKCLMNQIDLESA